MQDMFKVKNAKASEVHYTRSMPYNAQMIKPAQNRAIAGQNSG